ncbi:MAG: peptide chain release factor 3 [Maricaulaceae bacterium]|jgi:peptide chain release factor 3
MSQSTTGAEAARRRTFAIISHPDAGKTTLTENLLLASGSIRQAGAVRARGERRRTRSDWMAIERERGISVSASVMTFEHAGLVFNLLDTPGHEDFSEDTYRTLTAADCAVMVIDAAKGIEPQTLKLFEVCRLRDIPIVTFINKMDREARDCFELIDEIQDKLALDAAPLQWPLRSGERFRGVADLERDEFVLYRRATSGETHQDASERASVDDLAARGVLDEAELEELREESGLAGEGYARLNEKSFLEGHMTPVLFGSALRGFGVRELLDALARLAPPPAPVKSADGRMIDPSDAEVTGFVFKIQANMDPQHRDRIAFVKLVSGTFKRGMKLKTLASGKPLTVSSPVMFFANDRDIADEAFPGDVIGAPNHGVLRVGDSLSETGRAQFAGIPNFAPEILRRARLLDPMKAKHLRKALESLAEEGVTQLFKPAIGADMIVGAVGVLQFEVMSERLQTEYSLDVTFEVPPFETARWLAADDPADIEDFAAKHRAQMAEDLDESPVFLAKNAWEASYVEEKFPKVRFLTTRERQA